jgi:hypothetical protein
MEAHPVPRYFLYICLGYGVKDWDIFLGYCDKDWELVIPWEHTQGPDIACIFV